jgi:hypothetical protein
MSAKKPDCEIRDVSGSLAAGRKKSAIPMGMASDRPCPLRVPAGVINRKKKACQGKRTVKTLKNS